MKKVLTLTMTLLFGCTILGADANWLGETNKALYKANQAVSTANEVDQNIKKANTKEAKEARKARRKAAKENAKAAAKSAAQNEAQYQTNRLIDRIFK